MSAIIERIVKENSCADGVGLRYNIDKTSNPPAISLVAYKFDDIVIQEPLNLDNFFQDIHEHSTAIMDIIYDKSKDNPKDILFKINQASAMIAHCTRRAAGNTVWVHPSIDVTPLQLGGNRFKVIIDMDMPDDLILVTYTQQNDKSIFKLGTDMAIFMHDGKYYNGHYYPMDWKSFFFMIKYA